MTKQNSQPSRDVPRFVAVLLFKLVVLVTLAAALPLGAQSELRFADLGDFQLVSGEVIQQCKIGYRTFGKLDEKKSNAILFPAWFSGNSQDLAQYVGPDKMVDSSKYFVITVDPLGNGVSSSPSNSAVQPGASFPRFTIRDMVASQHRLVTEVLGISQLHAVMGISMGGMQTLQWIVSYPSFVERAVPIVGSPRLAPYDLLLWTTQLAIIEEELKDHPDPKEARTAAMGIIARLQELALSTPAHFNAGVARDALAKSLSQKGAESIQRHDPYDWAAQLRAMIDHDVTAPFGGDLEQAAAEVEAEVLVVAAEQDHMVTPGPVLQFAEYLDADTVILDGDCGHLAPGCELKDMQEAVREFLDQLD
jgi:homoserine O-acetyltransferase